eukprot:TRINITY_DN48009_c0_g3_i1.p2 TRINITY_DN48009_c0_g3~~TRINITY_DN48009_c0_g3_i1.p2  ORF type:complete len:440 (-),score=253.12 TRINITY_DN48009_c0_g3_i1:22-1176(-)
MKELLAPKQMFCRVYILRATKLVPADRDGTADPYLIVKLGGEKITTRKRYKKDTLEPEFYESFEIPCTMPGDAKLRIEVWDWDGIGDDLMGVTEVDIEDRFFCDEWRELNPKPLEHRSLRSPTSSATQGKLVMWVEMLSSLEAKRIPMANIKPPPPQPWELRVIVWGCKDVTIKDEITQQNDLYVTCHCSAPGLKRQKTDTHLRSKLGFGSFNWRMKFPLMLPMKPAPRLRFQIWDKDFFSANDSICEAVVSLAGLCKQAARKRDSVKVLLNGKDRFWLENLRHPNFEGTQGKLEVSIELLPESVGTQFPAGPGRSEPNQNPVLPPPEGRMIWTLNPITMLRQILGDKLFFKLCAICFVALVLGAIGMVAPMIMSNVASKWVVG